MKKIITYIQVLFIFSTFFSCKAQSKAEKENLSIIPFINSYIDFCNKKSKIDKEKEIIVVGAYDTEDKKDYWINVYFINPELLSGLKYSKVYKYEGYKMVLDESLSKTELLKDVLGKNITKYEDFNLAKLPYSVNLEMWRICFNKKNEVILISPQEKAETIKTILEKKGVRFSKDYID